MKIIIERQLFLFLFIFVSGKQLAYLDRQENGMKANGLLIDDTP